MTRSCFSISVSIPPGSGSYLCDSRKDRRFWIIWTNQILLWQNCNRRRGNCCLQYDCFPECSAAHERAHLNRFFVISINPIFIDANLTPTPHGNQALIHPHPLFKFGQFSQQTKLWKIKMRLSQNKRLLKIIGHSFNFDKKVDISVISTRRVTTLISGRD